MRTLFYILPLLTLVLSYELSINNPWAQSVWKSGQEVNVSYSFKGEEDKPIAISVDLMSGDPDDGLHLDNIATNVDPRIKKNCTWKVPDYPAGKDYFVRIGNGEHWYFSHYFELQGTGKQPLPQKSTSQGTVVYKDNKVKAENSTKVSTTVSNASKATIQLTLILIGIVGTNLL